jgi:hypothetical protein
MSGQKSQKLVVLTVGMTAVAFGSWLLLADVNVGQAGSLAGNGKSSAAALKAKRASQKAVPKAAVAARYGGYGGLCRQQSVSPRPWDRVPSKGRHSVVESSSDLVPGSNADGSSEAYLIDAASRTVTQMTSDTMRCFGGGKHGQACMVSRDCPAGSCSGTDVGGSGIANKGQAPIVYLVFDGNPLGTNPDLGDELWMWTPGKRKKPAALSQLTTMPGWCSDDITRNCTSSADCEDGGCSLAGIGGLQVGERSTDPVIFVTTGNPDGVGGNEGHGSAVYSLAGKKKKRGLGLIGPAGRTCAATTQNAGQSCTKDEDCGAACGNGMIEPGEQCDGTSKGCGEGQFCLPAGSPGQCTCATPSCGDGFIDSGEECDTVPSSSSTCLLCKSDCTCVRCGDGEVESPEQCDPSAFPNGCAEGTFCGSAGSDKQCTCFPATCGNGEVEPGEECDGYVSNSGSCVSCKSDCTCVRCGDGQIESPEQCDWAASPSGCNLGETCSSSSFLPCRCIVP